MGNCVFRGFGGVQDKIIRVVTSNGGIMELHAPTRAECITNEFPGHGLFRSRDLFSRPILHSEELRVGELYYILPLNKTAAGDSGDHQTRSNKTNDHTVSINESLLAPYRMSLDNQRMLKRSEAAAAAAEVFPRYNSTGVWKVKLVISPQQLSEILSQDARTEALIESVRTVAKCGKHGLSSSSSSSSSASVANSDQCGAASSWNWKASSDPQVQYASDG